MKLVEKRLNELEDANMDKDGEEGPSSLCYAKKEGK